MKIHDDGFTPSHLLQWSVCQSRADAGKYTQLEFRRRPWFTRSLQCRWTPSRVTTQRHMAEVSGGCGGGGVNALKHGDQRLFFVLFFYKSASGRICAGIWKYKTKASGTGQMTWIRSLEMGNYSQKSIVVIYNFLLPWWQEVHRYQTKMHLLKLAILMPTPSSLLVFSQQTFQ